MGRVLRVTRLLGDDRPLAVRLRDALDEVLPAVRAARAFWVLGDANGDVLLVVGRHHQGREVGEREIGALRGLMEESLRAGRPLTLGSGSAGAGGLGDLVCRPCSRGGEVLGLLCVQGFPQGPAFTEYDQGLLEILADQGASALQSARVVRESSREARLLATGNLAAGVTHDFNNILATVLGRTLDLLKASGDPAAKEGLLAIERAARQGADVVRRVEELTRRHEGGEEERRQLAQLVDDVVEFTRFRWEGRALSHGHRLRVLVDVPPDLFVNGFAPELSEAFTAVMLAGIDSLPEGGELCIRAQGDNDRAVITLDASGTGLPGPGRLELLDPYGAVEGEVERGAGLSAACRVMKGLGGSLGLEEEGEESRRFRLTLPLRAAPAAREAPPGPEDLAPAQGQRVLVVDDEEGVRELLRDLLEMAGMEVEVAADGPEALELFQRRPASLVLTDLGMEPWSGWDVAERVKESAPATVVVLITGWAGEVPLEVARERSVDHLLSKPFDIDEVVATVSRALAART